METNSFTQYRQQNILKNVKFNVWNKDNKIVNDKGLPIISFHGSVYNIFKEISFDKSNDFCCCGKGFYTSNDINDINNNYANEEGGDLFYRKIVLRDKINKLDSFSDSFFNCLNFRNKIDNNKILYSDAIKLNNGKWKNIAINLSKINKIFTIFCLKKYINWDLFLKAIINKTYIYNKGYIMPVYIKMTNPAYYTKDYTATMVSPKCNSDHSIYNKIKNKCISLSIGENYKIEIIKFFNEIENNVYDLEKNKKFTTYNEQIKLEDIFNKSRINNDRVMKKIFNQAISVVFDGLVFNIYDDKKEYNMSNTRKETIHYIVFEKNSVKSAIGNNGNFSLFDNDFNK
jgi:hypothetical protein